MYLFIYINCAACIGIHYFHISTLSMILSDTLRYKCRIYKSKKGLNFWLRAYMMKVHPEKCFIHNEFRTCYFPKDDILFNLYLLKYDCKCFY